MPKPTTGSLRLFQSLVDGDTRLEVRKVFGQPTAFAQGNMCLGTFGSDVYLRLSVSDQRLASGISGTRPFEPMAGRPMSEYLVFPPAVLENPTEARGWVERSVSYTLSLPPKRPKPKRSAGVPAPHRLAVRARVRDPVR